MPIEIEYYVNVSISNNSEIIDTAKEETCWPNHITAIGMAACYQPSPRKNLQLAKKRNNLLSNLYISHHFYSLVHLRPCSYILFKWRKSKIGFSPRLSYNPQPIEIFFPTWRCSTWTCMLRRKQKVTVNGYCRPFRRRINFAMKNMWIMIAYGAFRRWPVTFVSRILDRQHLKKTFKHLNVGFIVINFRKFCQADDWKQVSCRLRKQLSNEAFRARSQIDSERFFFYSVENYHIVRRL